MNRLTHYFALLLALALSVGATPISEHGKLSVNGRALVDSKGDTVVLRGMSLYWYNGDWGGGQPGNGYYNQDVIDKLASTGSGGFGASVVRGAFGNQNDVAAAKSLMDYAKNAGIYVIVDNHTHTAENELSASQDFFRQVASYAVEKNYTHVFYEIYNEPINSTWAQIKSYAESVIPVIRNIDKDGIILVGTPSYSSDLANPNSSPLTGSNAHNVMYVLHFYAGTSGHNNYRLPAQKAWCDNLPFFVTEWGTCESDGKGELNTSNSNTWISLLEAMKVSHANWSLANGTGSCDAFSGDGTSGNFSFSTSGNYMRNLLTKLNTGKSLADAGLSATTVDCSRFEGPTDPVRDGRIAFGSSALAANYLTVEGADSLARDGGGVMLRNTAKDFTASYTFTNLPGKGYYRLQFYTSATADGGKISWSGDGITAGELEIPSTGSLQTFAYTDVSMIGISTDATETTFNVSVTTNAANSTGLYYVYARTMRSSDSVGFGLLVPKDDGKGGAELDENGDTVYVVNPDIEPPTPVLSAPSVLRQGQARVFDIRGNLVAKFDLSGQPQGLPLQGVKNLTPGVYILNWQGQSRRIYVR